MKGKYSKSINAQRRQSVLEYVKEHYALEKLLKDLGVWDGGATVITCPFHPDSRPSFNINIDDGFYKCFSCGSSGGYMSFYHEYHKRVIEDDKYFNDHVEEVLQNDIVMQETLGFSTIFVKIENNLSLQDVVNFKYKPHEYVRVENKSLQLIQRKLQKDHEKMTDFFADVERGVGVSDLWNKYVLGVKLDDVTLDEQGKTEIELAFSALLSEDDDDDNLALTALFGEE